MGTGHSRRARSSSYSSLGQGCPTQSGQGYCRSIQFSTYHGTQLRLSPDGATIKRKTFSLSFSRKKKNDCGGLSFSNRVVNPGEVLTIDVQNLALRMAFVTEPPDAIMSRSPKCSMDTSMFPKEMMAFSLFVARKKKQCIELFYDHNGDVHYALDGRERGVFYNMIPKGMQVWAMIDVHQKDKGLQEIDPNTSVIRTFRSSSCLACLDHDVSSRLSSCGHECLCYECAIQWGLARSQRASCPLCRTEIRGVLCTE